MVLDRCTGEVEHTRFHRLAYLRPGDLLVFNSSRTLPAGARRPHRGRPGHRGTAGEPDDTWPTLLVCREGDPGFDLRAGMRIAFGLGWSTVLSACGHPAAVAVRPSASGGELIDLLHRSAGRST
jgi:S-adenosylmethionine:tRNA ribosyltransferase-isomerase